MEEVTGSATQATESGLQLFMAWLMTPTGATLTLLILLLGGASIAGRALGWSTRLLKTMVTVAGVLLFVWIISGILSAMGVPVREWIASIGSWFPRLWNAFIGFLEKLVQVSG